MRSYINNYNSAHGTHFKLWDFWGVGDGGVIDPSGNPTGINLYAPTYDYSQTDAESLFLTWTSTEEYWTTVRNRIMGSFEVIAFKSCFVQNNIQADEELQQRKDWYSGMRSFFDLHPEKLFVVISLPTQTPLETTATQAAYARAFANWLKSSAYLSGHPNVVCFDLFDYLASPDNDSSEANMLRPEYRGVDPHDSHPNTLANQTVGPIFAQFLINAALNY